MIVEKLFLPVTYEDRGLEVRVTISEKKADRIFTFRKTTDRAQTNSDAAAIVLPTEMNITAEPERPGADFMVIAATPVPIIAGTK